MEDYRVELTENEQVLVARIDFESHTHEAYLDNQAPILALLRSLSDRNAIPAQRLKYWNDPEYSMGGYRHTSNKGTFERNGVEGDEIYTHPHFLKYLRYFLYGPDLPDKLMEQFKSGCEAGFVNIDYVTSSDITPICKSARAVARIAIREHKLKRHHVTEEFFKLCLDMGLDVSDARVVRGDVARIR